MTKNAIVERKPELTRKQLSVLETLELKRGNIAAACRAAGVSRQAYYNWLDDNVVFEDAVLDVREGLIDRVEDKLLELVDAGNVVACIFFLKCKAKRRGYIEQPAPGDLIPVLSEIEVLG